VSRAAFAPFGRQRPLPRWPVLLALSGCCEGRRPLACILGLPRLYFTYILPVFHVYPACISPISCLYLTISLVSRCIWPFCSRSTVSRCIPLYPAVSVRIKLYSAVPAASRCISSYLTASKTGYGQKYTPREG